MEEYTHCQKFLHFDLIRPEKISHTTREEPTSSSSSPPEFHIDFKLSCKPLVYEYELNQDSELPHFLRMSRFPIVRKLIRLNLDQFSNQETARQIIEEKTKSWRLWDDGRRLMSDFILDKGQEIVESMPTSHNAVYVNIHVIPVHVHSFYEREASESEIEQSMEEGDEDCMVPAAGSVIESLESMKITLFDDLGSCSICLENFSRDFEGVCMPCSHVFHGDCIKEWLRTSHYCPVCRFEMPTS